MWYSVQYFCCNTLAYRHVCMYVCTCVGQLTWHGGYVSPYGRGFVGHGGTMGDRDTAFFVILDFEILFLVTIFHMYLIFKCIDVKQISQLNIFLLNLVRLNTQMQLSPGSHYTT